MNRRYKPENLARNGPGRLRRSRRSNLWTRTAIHNRDKTANSEGSKDEVCNTENDDILMAGICKIGVGLAMENVNETAYHHLYRTSSSGV